MKQQSSTVVQITTECVEICSPPDAAIQGGHDMRKLIYAVLRIDNEWRVICERRHIGHFETQNQAIVLGAALVREALEAGCEAELLVLDRAGKLVGERFTPSPPHADGQPLDA